MVYAPKDLRNESLVKKRIKDPKKWSWAKLGVHYDLHRSVAKQIFERDVEKFSNEYEIEMYESRVKKLKYRGKTKF
jgi:hypothetical protein